MRRIDELRAELATLEALERRAERLRGKTGRMEVSQETLDALEGALGHDLPSGEEPDGRITLRIEQLAAAIAVKLAK